jgi:uncharacterized protein (TIGR00369 family)
MRPREGGAAQSLPQGRRVPGADQFAPTIEIKVSFLRPARPGPIIAEGRVVHRTRSLAFLEGTLATDEGDLIATGTATARISGRPEDGVNGDMG